MISMNEIVYKPAGDSGVLIQFGDRIDEDINRKVSSLCRTLEEHRIKGVMDMIPSYTSLLVVYDGSVTSYRKVLKKIQRLESGLTEDNGVKKRIVHHIPVCYDEAFAPDLKDVAAYAGLSQEEVIRLHCEREYLIYMLGFLPGFVYLGGLDQRIACPRLQSPRVKIPVGAVGIGGEQTGIYPLESPGGWRLIGSTPLKVYDAERKPPILYQMGEYIKFDPVRRQEYEDIAKLVKTGEYQHRIEEK